MIHTISGELHSSLHIPTQGKIQFPFLPSSDPLTSNHLINDPSTFRRVAIGNILATMHELKSPMNSRSVIIGGQPLFTAPDG